MNANAEKEISQGEWYWHENTASTQETACIDVRFDRDGRNRQIAYLQSWPGHVERTACVANANLIIASPEMFRAIERFLNAPRSEHLITRLNDEEMAAVEEMKCAIRLAHEGRQLTDPAAEESNVI